MSSFDEKELEDLYLHYQNRFVRFTEAYIRDEFMAEDIVEESIMYYYCPIKILQNHKIRADFICEVSPFSLDFSRQTIKSNHGQKYTF